MLPLTARDRDYQRIVVLTGAGISASAGLPTFRGPDGLWTKHPELASQLVAGVAPSVMWRALGPLRADVVKARPTAAHLALAKYAASSGADVKIITQNIDGLHERAGSPDVIALHGRLLRTRCSSCSLPAFDDAEPYVDAPPCPRCGAPLRPDVVLFEEPLGADEEVMSKRALRDCDLFVAIGTSGTVWPAASFVRSAAYEGAHTIFVNMTPLEEHIFDEIALGPADDVVPALFS